MKSAKQRYRRVKLTALTGHHAPITGWWRPDPLQLPARYFHEGEMLPPVNGTRVRWTQDPDVPTVANQQGPVAH